MLREVTSLAPSHLRDALLTPRLTRQLSRGPDGAEVIKLDLSELVSLVGRHSQGRHNMEYYIFVLHLTLAVGLKDLGSNEYNKKPKVVDNCVDMSHFLEVEYNVTETRLCSFKQRTYCEPRQSEVCREVPVTKCRIVGYTECEETPEIHQVRDDMIVTETFIQKECSPVKKIVTEIKKAPHCEMIIKPQCDSKWVVDEYGQKTFATTENCKNITWEDCKLVDRQVDKEVNSYECHPSAQPLMYQTVVDDPQEVTTVKRVCQPRVENMCEVTMEQLCETVEWEQCRDTVQPNCFDFQMRIPHQEHNHLLRCIDH